MMGGKRGRPANGQQDRVRTHLFFSKQTARPHQKRKHRTQNKLHQVTHKKDEIIQTGELDPSEWTGNQRVLHFGPMAQRDPYFYYYPKGWDVLYPAYFGFFPYRTKKFRGSSSIVCICAFGVFMILGGSLMVYMGFFLMHDSPFWTWTADRRHRPPPIQIAGPILFGSGTVLVLGAIVYSLITSSFFKMYLHHTKRHDEPARVTTITTTQYLPAVYEKESYHPLPPPAYPVLENKYAHSSIVRPHGEMKLYPPVIPGCSTLSLHRKSPSSIFVASPYNTLRAASVGRYHSGLERQVSIVDQRERAAGSVSRKASVESGKHKRSKSVGPLHRPSSSQSSIRSRYRKNSQI